MTKNEFDQLNKFEESYWWHVGRRFFLDKMLIKYFFCLDRMDRTILDFGCGTGGNYKLLSKFGEVTGVDNSELSADYCRKKNQKVEIIKGSGIPFPDGTFDLITSFDVLEHIEDDKAALKEFGRVLKNNGMVLVTVPAYKFIWSEHDELLGHFRRYGKKELATKLEKNGFEVVKISHAVSSIFPLIFAFRMYRRAFSGILKKKKVSYVTLPGIINDLLARVVKAESLLLERTDLPFGCSIIAVARKR